MTRKEILKKAVDVYGKEAQVDMCVEECSELIKALLKERRLGYEKADPAKKQLALEHVREELADVQIMLEQMRLVFGDTQEAETEKLTRLQANLEKI